MDIIQTLNDAASARVLVVGSLPPGGRDVDLLVLDSDRKRLEAALGQRGFEQQGDQWVRFAECSARSVELIAAESWRLSPPELQALFAEGVRLPGCRQVVRPAPHHALLILARRIAAERCLPDKHRARVTAALAESPGAWAEARRSAPAWGAARALVMLEAAYGDRGPTGAARRFAKRPRPGAVISLSGLDGAGKSSQARALADALEQLGFHPVIVWTPLGNNPFQRRVASAVKRGLAQVRLGPFAGVSERSSSGEPMLSRQGASGASRSLPASIATNLWATFGGGVNGVWHLRSAAWHVARGRIVIFDRYILDSVVQLRFAYGPERSLRVPISLVRTLSLKPKRAFLLDVRPETALARKNEQWTLSELTRQTELYRAESDRLGVKRLDGELSREELCAGIVRDVWHALRAANDG